MLGILLTTLSAATILEKVYGTEMVSSTIYSSVPFVMLWGATALVSLLYILGRKLQRHTVTFLLHLSFLLILAGAFTTWLCGKQGNLRLLQGEAQTAFMDKDAGIHLLPFQVSLEKFEIIYYNGTRTPQDFVSHIAICDKQKGKCIKGDISMNHVFAYRDYRFYQSGYGADGKGSILSVSHDPYGIALTYTGYALLLCTMILFFFTPHSRFRQLARKHLSCQGGAAIMGLLLLTSPKCEAATVGNPLPETLPREVAESFGNLYILYNGRICPMQTFARHFTTKLYGKTSYRNFTAEQVLAGWLFFPGCWKDEPIIRIKSRELRRLTGAGNGYASFKQLEDVLTGGMTAEETYRTCREEQDKLYLIRAVCNGERINIFPCRHTEANTVDWYSPGEWLSREPGNGGRVLAHKFMNDVGRQAAMGHHDEALRLFGQIREFQQETCGELLPSADRFKAEKLYNRLEGSKPVAICCICMGLAGLGCYCYNTTVRKKAGRKTIFLAHTSLTLLFLYLSTIICLRGYVSHHLPLSDGFETMQFMAWCAVLLALLLRRKFAMVLPFGFLTCGLALLVSTLGASNPPITPLMPVLQSPLLSLHVAAVMLAYSLLAFVMLNGVTAVILYQCRKGCEETIEELQAVSLLILYPAVFLLATGIFIGAVWANVSWGRYWGWDPKEVWALITLLVYASPLHAESLPWFRRPLFFHTFSIVAFATVLATYFGVNFLLGGMHSYANG